MPAITADHVRSYLAEVMKTRAARRCSAACSRSRPIFAGVKRWQIRQIAQLSNPVRALRSPRAQRHLPAKLPEDDVRRLIEAESEDTSPAALRDRAILEVLYSSGLRVSELVGLNWRDVDDELGMVMVRSGKGNKDRMVPIGEPAIDALKAWRRAMPKAWTRRPGDHQSARRAADDSRGREHRGAAHHRGGPRSADHAARPAPLFRDAHAQRGRRLALDSGDARAMRASRPRSAILTSASIVSKRSIAVPIREPESDTRHPRHDDPVRAPCRQSGGRGRRPGQRRPDHHEARAHARCAACTTTRCSSGFAGSTADALTLFDKFEGKLQEFNGNLRRAAVEMAKDWRTDRVLRRLEAMLIVADRESSLLISGPVT